MAMLGELDFLSKQNIRNRFNEAAVNKASFMLVFSHSEVGSGIFSVFHGYEETATFDSKEEMEQAIDNYNVNITQRDSFIINRRIKYCFDLSLDFEKQYETNQWPDCGAQKIIDQRGFLQKLLSRTP